MPLPTPRGDESEQDFVSRFMGDAQAVSDFPDEKQRAAVAYKQYRDEEMEELQLPSVSILEEGEAKGHDLFVDRTSLEKALNIMREARNGVKVKMNHGSGLDAVVGFARNPRIDGNKLVADLRLLRNSPHYGLIREMASEAPDQFGVSLAFVNESEMINGRNYIRPQSIASADLVSSPAATNGLFEEVLAFMEKIRKFDCGTGAGGFKEGNSCAKGGSGGESSSEGPKESAKESGDNKPNTAAIKKTPIQNPGENDNEYGKSLPKRIKEDISKSRNNLKAHISDAKNIKITSADSGWTGSRSIHADNIQGILSDFKKNTASHRYGPTTDKQREYYRQTAKMLRDDAEKMYGGMGKDKIGSKWDNLAYSAQEAADAIDKMAVKRFEEEISELRKYLEFRCWEGYKPTPGKKPYSEGSCMKAEEKTETKNSGGTTQMGYMVGGKPIPADSEKPEKDGESLTTEGENMGTDYGKDIEEIKTRLSALEQLATPKSEDSKTPEISVEVEPSEKEDNGEEMAKKEMKPEEMSELVKKVLTEFGIKPIPASPVTEEAPAKKEEPKNFEALVAAHPDYGTSKLKAMKAVMLSNPKEYAEALCRGISKL